jgi:O-antigen/teichoic acid export membrane protein
MSDSTDPILVPVSRQLGRQTIFALFGNACTLLVSFPLQIYVSRVLGPENLGVFSLIEGALGTAVGILGLGIGPTLVRFIPVYLARGEFGKIRTLFRWGGFMLIATGLTAYLVLLAGLIGFGAEWEATVRYRVDIALMGMMIPLGLLFSFLQQGLRAFQDVRNVVLGSSVVQLGIKTCVTLVVFYAGFRLQGYILATLAGSLCSVVWMGASLTKRLNRVPSEVAPIPSGDSTYWVRYAGTSYMTGILAASAIYLDRFLLGIFSGSGTVGVFTIANQLQMMPLVFLQMFLMVGAPMFAAAHGRNDPAERQHLYHVMTDWAMRSSLPLLIFLLLFASPVLRLYGNSFASEGAGPLIIMMIGQVINVACGPIVNVLMITGLERRFLFINVIAIIWFVGLMVILVPPLGAVGAAVAIAAGRLFINVCAMLTAWQRLKLRWRSRRFLGWLLPGSAILVMGAGIRLMDVDAGGVGLAAILVAMYAVFFGVSLLQGLSEEDADLLRHLRDELTKRIRLELFRF